MKSRLIEDPFAAKPTSSNVHFRQPVTSQYPNNLQQRLFEREGEYEHIRFAISTVFQGFKLVKTSQYGPWGVYKSPVNSMVANTDKYIVAIVENDSVPLGSIVPLESIKWKSFQTRSCADITKEMNGYYIATQGYTLPRERNTILYDKIKKVMEYPDKCIFLPDNLPIKLEVLKSKEDEFIADEGNVIACLELYQTILSLQDIE